MAGYTEEKSYDPTPRRREEAHRQGQVATSQDLGSAVILIAGTLIVMFLGGAIVHVMIELMEKHLRGSVRLTDNISHIVAHWHWILEKLAKILLPIYGLLMLTGILVSLLQVGFIFVPNRITPDLKRINPLQGFHRICSLSNTVRLGFGFLKVLVIAAIALQTVWAAWDEILASSQMQTLQIAQLLTEKIFWISLKIGSGLLILGLIDYFYQRWKHEQDLKMTSHEAREDMKNDQGDPKITAGRLTMQRQILFKNLSCRIQKADVVITHPSGLAIAIHYGPEETLAPVVVAKGADTLAEKIQHVAREYDIPLVENSRLARALYQNVATSRPIPDSMYVPVAEVLTNLPHHKGKTAPTLEHQEV